MTLQGVYAFDEADAELSLLPMAARRALDVAGVHVALAAWRTLARDQRAQLIALGANDRVDAEAVSKLLREAGLELRAEAGSLEVPIDELPSDVRTLLAPERALTLPAWQALRPLDRYVLAKLARRGRRERLAVAFDEIVTARP